MADDYGYILGADGALFEIDIPAKASAATLSSLLTAAGATAAQLSRGVAVIVRKVKKDGTDRAAVVAGQSAAALFEYAAEGAEYATEYRNLDHYIGGDAGAITDAVACLVLRRSLPS